VAVVSDLQRADGGPAAGERRAARRRLGPLHVADVRRRPAAERERDERDGQFEPHGEPLRGRRDDVDYVQYNDDELDHHHVDHDDDEFDDDHEHHDDDDEFDDDHEYHDDDEFDDDHVEHDDDDDADDHEHHDDDADHHDDAVDHHDEADLDDDWSDDHNGKTDDHHDASAERCAGSRAGPRSRDLHRIAVSGN
jgi:hypothetical protein